jgi:xanthine dehydrogenase accessory factor
VSLGAVNDGAVAGAAVNDGAVGESATCEKRAGIACAILAAGGSRRLGRPKQLVTVGGQPLLRRVAVEACASTCARVAVVLGAHAAAISPTLSGVPVTRLDNAAWNEGVASSIRCAVAWADATRSEALILCVCDQVSLNAAHLDRMIAAYRRGLSSMVGSGYAGICGVPALFASDCFSELETLKGDRGAIGLLRDDPQTVAVPWDAGVRDLDTEQDEGCL